MYAPPFSFTLFSSVLLRRCAHDLAKAGCDGLDAPGTIVRCDKCLGSFHVSCGKVGLGKEVFHTDARDGALCRACSRQIYRSQNKDPWMSVLKQMALARAKRKSMLEFLEKEAEGGGRPDGVFNLNVSHCMYWYMFVLFRFFRAKTKDACYVR